MAKEMMEQTKNSILAQASQAMLAQSNQITAPPLIASNEYRREVRSNSQHADDRSFSFLYFLTFSFRTGNICYRSFSESLLADGSRMFRIWVSQ